MTLPDDPQQPDCLPCRRGRCLGCLWESRRTGCSCSCSWLQADMLANFPSLRRKFLEGEPMTDATVDDDDYTEDAQTVPEEDLPEPADPAQVPPDEGDAGAAK